MSQYAIVETGSKQYWVEPKAIIEVELLEIPAGQKEVSLNKVLLVKAGDKVQVGNPTVAGASVVCENLGEFRGPKVISFKFRRRKASRKKRGHRQDMLKLRVKEIIAGK